MIQIKIQTRLQQLRNEYGAKRKDVVAMMPGYSVNNLSQWECGHCRPSYEALADLAQIYHTTTDYLIGLTDERGMFDDKQNYFDGEAYR